VTTQPLEFIHLNISKSNIVKCEVVSTLIKLIFSRSFTC